MQAVIFTAEMALIMCSDDVPENAAVLGGWFQGADDGSG
jgi:CheY-like chemotaxis protein